MLPKTSCLFMVGSKSGPIATLTQTNLSNVTNDYGTRYFDYSAGKCKSKISFMHGTGKEGNLMGTTTALYVDGHTEQNDRIYLHNNKTRLLPFTY